MQNKPFINLAWLTLFVIYLVIIAGSVVRATDSGMGCPDWPKCFGYLIPPSEESQVVFQPQKAYKKGQIIVNGNELWEAKESFVSVDTIDDANWQVYEKHDYAVYNPTHTWIEYINRLLGATSGLFMFALFIYSIILLRKKQVKIPVVLWSFLGVILLGFQAWLGKTVVDSHLAAAKITAHLFGALAIVAVILIIIRIVKGNSFMYVTRRVKYIAWLAFILFMIQLFLGTEVRQLVDDFYPLNQLDNIFENNQFKIHRSFSWLVVITSVFLVFSAVKAKLNKQVFLVLLVFLILEFLVGIFLFYFQIPRLAQPIHLLLANLIFGVYVWILLSRVVDK